MRELYSDYIGNPDKDAVHLVIKTKDTRREIKIYGGYEVKNSVLTQPGAFSFRCGWSEQLIPLLKFFNACPEFDETNKDAYPQFELRVADTVVMSGIVEAVDVTSFKASEIEIRGRDWMMPFFKCGIVNEVTLQEQTYGELVKKIMYKCLPDNGAGHELFFSNEENRQIITRTKFQKKRVKVDMNKNQLVASIDTGIAAPGGGKITTQHLIAKVGDNWFQWLDKQLQLAGLLLWARGDGHFVLGSPTITMDPLYRIVRREGMTLAEAGIVDGGLRQDYANQNTSIICHGRYGAGAGGRNRAFALQENVEAVRRLGGVDSYPMVFEDDDVKNDQQANYVAGRRLSEQARAGFSLKYIMPGHRCKCAVPGYEDQMVIWEPDTIVDVQDDWLGFHELMYVEGVTFRSSPETTTVIDLIRPRYLHYFATQGSTSI